MEHNGSAPAADDWFAEGTIQEHVLAYLETEEGYTILSRGQPSLTEQGIDIVAERRTGDRVIHSLVTVRGWPRTHHTHGALAGQPRTTRPEVLARNWMAQVVLDLALGRGADPEVALGLGLPAMAGYIRYLQRLRWFLATARVAIYLVSEEGRVTVTPPGAAAPGVLTPSGPPPATAGKRRKLGLPGATRLHLPLLHALVSAGGTAGRAEVIPAVARWFPEVPLPAPAEFGQRLSVAQTALQDAGLTELDSRGIWRITEAGRAHYSAEWAAWRQTREP